MQKYRNFVDMLVHDCTGNQQHADELKFAIENDCMNWDSVVQLVTGDDFESLKTSANIMKNLQWFTSLELSKPPTMIQNEYSRMVRWANKTSHTWTQVYLKHNTIVSHVLVEGNGPDLDKIVARYKHVKLDKGTIPGNIFVSFDTDVRIEDFILKIFDSATHQYLQGFIDNEEDDDHIPGIVSLRFMLA